MGVMLAIIAGMALGGVLERGDFCFHSTLRGLFRAPRQLQLFSAYLLTLVVAIPLVQIMTWAGWIKPWVPPFVWQANIVGGVLFGVGMVVASSCITGFFYKLGHGMLGVLVGLAAWAVGDIVTYRGPLSPLRAALNRAPVTIEGQPATLLNVLAPATGWIVLAVLCVATLFYLWRMPRADRTPYWGWLPLGVTTGLVLAAAWVGARLGGANYAYGTSGVPTALYGWIVDGLAPHYWIPVSLIALIPGAFVAAYLARTLWVRGERPRRYAELATGGLLMGVGAAISGGCNLGHSLVGVPLLSLGSITTTLSMTLGVYVAHRVVETRVIRRDASPTGVESAI